MQLIGTLDGGRAVVDHDGTVRAASATERHAVRWWVAADDRWHDPRQATAVRQTTLGGTPVVETRLRIPGGDARQRVWSVPDRGGWTVIEVANQSPLPIAVAFSGTVAVRAGAQPTEPRGLAEAAGAIALPVGHGSAVRVGVPNPGNASTALPDGLPAAEAVQRGWMRLVERAARYDLPDAARLEELVAARCGLALRSDACLAALSAADVADSNEALIGVGELARMGLVDDTVAVEVAAAAQRCRTGSKAAWIDRAARRGARLAFVAIGEAGAAGGVARISAAVGHAARPNRAPSGIAFVPWVEQGLADDDGTLLAEGWSDRSLGAPLAVHGLPVGCGTVSFALRWHGARPAVLWQATNVGVPLRAPAVAGEWSTSEPSGEALWPAPASVDRSS